MFSILFLTVPVCHCNPFWPCVVKIELAPVPGLLQNCCCWKWLVSGMPNSEGAQVIQQTMPVTGASNGIPGLTLRSVSTYRVPGQGYIYIISEEQTPVVTHRIWVANLNTHHSNLAMCTSTSTWEGTMSTICTSRGGILCKTLVQTASWLVKMLWENPLSGKFYE